MTLDFDDPIPDIYDGIYTIKFVNSESGSDNSSESEGTTDNETGSD